MQRAILKNSKIQKWRPDIPKIQKIRRGYFSQLMLKTENPQTHRIRKEQFKKQI